MEHALEYYLKHPDNEISGIAKGLISIGYPLHSYFEIRLKQIIK